jgi:hypothetical protein
MLFHSNPGLPVLADDAAAACDPRTGPLRDIARG